MTELTYQDVLNLLPEREENAHKGNFGKLLLVCGSKGYTGAAFLAVMGALRTGAGLAFLGVPESIYAIEAVKLNEAVVFPLPDRNGMLAEEALPELLRRAQSMDAILIGCGMGLSEHTEHILTGLLEGTQCPAVIDADGITMAAKHKDLLKQRTAPTILTPHDGEFRRLGFPLNEDRIASAEAAAETLGAVVILKGHRSIITDGKRTFVNHTGNPGMAVGGSGDLLAGMISSLVGQGLPPLEAAASACLIHGAAGDAAAKRLGQYGMLPTDMLEEIPHLLK